MAQIPGTNVSAPVVPNDSNDVFASHLDTYGYRGWRVVNTLAERDAITTERRGFGMQVKVLETDKTYELKPTSQDLADNSNWTEAAGGQGGSTNLPTVDLLDLTTTQMDEVMALPYTSGDAPLSATPAWSKPGMWFDALDNVGVSWHYYCGRGNYTPGTPGSGIGPRWSQIKKY